MPLIKIQRDQGIKHVFIAGEGIADLASLELVAGERQVKMGATDDEHLAAGVSRGSASSGDLVRVIAQGIVSGVKIASGYTVAYGDRLMLATSGAVRPLNTITPAGAISGYITGAISGYITVTGSISGYVTGVISGYVTGDISGYVTGNISGYIPQGAVGYLSGILASGTILSGPVPISGYVSIASGSIFSSGSLAAAFSSGSLAAAFSGNMVAAFHSGSLVGLGAFHSGSMTGAFNSGAFAGTAFNTGRVLGRALTSGGSGMPSIQMLVSLE